MTEHFRSCPLCEAMCGLAIETDGERVVSIRGDREDPFSQGYVCPKGPALAGLHADPDRLRAPLKKEGGRFVECGWEEALELAAEGIHRVQEAHGRDAVAMYLGNPTVHSLPAALFAPMLMRALKTKNKYSATSVDQLPHHLAAHFMLGHQFLLPIPDIDRTDHMVILGANPLASNGSLMSAPDVKRRLKAIQERGGKVVVIDPRRTETAKVADAHCFIRPGTDAWLLAAILHVALRAGRGLGHLEGHVEGMDALREAMEPFTPERAAERTEIDEDTLVSMANELCAAERAVVYGRFGCSTQEFGGLCQWLIQAINLVTGNFDRPGGAMLTTPAVDAVNAPLGFGIGRGSFGRWSSRVRGLPEHNGELPVAVLAEEMLTEGEGQVRALITSAGNPVLSTPNGGQLDRAIAGLEHVVCVDFYVNETTRHASVILPPPSPLERPHYDVAFHHLAVRNTAKYAPPLFAPKGMPEHRILIELVERLERRRGTLTAGKRVRYAAMKRLGPEAIVDLGLRLGPHGARAWPPRRGLSVSALEKRPHGVDLGPLESQLPGRMKPWREKLDIAPKRFLEDLPRLEGSGGRVRGLSLIGRRHLRSNNSWMHNVPKLMAGKPICTLLMHPEDAEARGIDDGDEVEVRSRTGAVTVPVELTEDVMPGVVSLPHGFGHDREGVRLEVARAHAGASLNDLTDDRRVDALSGNAVLSGIPVEVA